ncbi:hypothetical protein INR49_006579 [Caranx melampygus]|nr:hypothetical protein INR49_006579 [Caranx melampygus]
MELKTVKMILAVVMLCSGFVHFVFANRLRIFNVTATEGLTWKESLDLCRAKNESLVTLYDQGDIDFTHNFSRKGNQGVGIFVGLRWTNKSVRWSDGTPYIFNRSTVNVSNGNLVCEGIEEGQWREFNCSDRKYFMCYEDDDYHLVERKKTWCQAQLHCRKYYTDLVHITNETQNEKIIEEGQNKSFWIGLMRDAWEWADTGCSTYRNHLEIGDISTMKCAYITPNFETKECEENVKDLLQTVCSKGKRRIVVINECKTWEEAFDYCENNYSNLLQIEDDEDRMAVDQWLNYTSHGDLFWIALWQSRVLGFWIWRDRTVNNHNWKNDQIPEMPLSNNCGAINGTDFKWRDENCLHKLPFLCEEEISFSQV